MRDAPLQHLCITRLAVLLETRAVTALEVVNACLAEIERREPEVNAFTVVLADLARERAQLADEEMGAGHYRGALHGVPVSVKDLVDVAGLPTTAASRVRSGHRASADAPVIKQLKTAGAVLIGKCNLHEFAYGTTGEDSAFGPTRNPWDLGRSPGGSSGGSAAAVATGMCAGSIGTDTGGSIRIPASACGIVGLKPTYGEIPCEGIVPLARSLDHVGPLARSVDDVWLLYLALKGARSTLPPELPKTAGVRLGVPAAYFFDLLGEDVGRVCRDALQRLTDAGCQIEKVTVDDAEYAPTVYLHTQLAEAAAYHAATMAARGGDYAEAVRLRLELGRYVMAEDYVRAQAGRRHLRAAIDCALEGVDALALPTLPIPPPRLGQTAVWIGGKREPVRSLMLRLTQPFNLTGHPAISLPCGRAGKLPCGLQLIGRHGGTDDLIRIARVCELHLHA